MSEDISPIPLLTDCHTHRKCEGAIVCVDPTEVAGLVAGCPSMLLSVGIHPWDTAGITADELAEKINRLESVASLPQVVAIGEAGLDGLRGGDAGVQTEALRSQIILSERVGKPLILHVVRSGHRVMALCREMERVLKPAGLRQPWIWHGFRGGAEEAARFLALRKENYISVGSRHNQAALSAIPPDRLLIETDDSALPIREVAGVVAAALALTEEEVVRIASRNLDRIIGRGE
ncbi:MAG: hypothetical protein HDS68_08635 [Bacteroidales bacterium]|nr:hypothetical protein [Bacteroidales bacterium]